MQKQEIFKRLKKLLEELEMSNEEYYAKEAAESDIVKNHMTPIEMYAYKVGAAQAEINWILEH